MRVSSKDGWLRVGAAEQHISALHDQKAVNEAYPSIHVLLAVTRIMYEIFAPDMSWGAAE